MLIDIGIVECFPRKDPGSTGNIGKYNQMDHITLLDCKGNTQQNDETINKQNLKNHATDGGLHIKSSRNTTTEVQLINEKRTWTSNFQ